MKKITPITAELINKVQSLNKEVNQLESQITDRIDYIIAFLFEGKDCCWWFEGAEEGEIGDFWRHYHAHEIWIITDPNLKISFIDKDGNDWEFEGSIPDRWLFEDFENEIIEGKKLFEERKAKRNLEQIQLKEQNKKEKNQLIESAKKKLSKEELKALGVKL